MAFENPPSGLGAYRAGHLLVGKYLLGRLLGEGGSGHVWLAHNIDLAAPVALKLLRTDGDSPVAPDRLKREAQATARLEHPAIVRVFDCGTTERGHPFMVMELLEGKTLAELLLTRGAMSAVAAVQLLLPVVDALATAHDRGVVHRDIKPDNIFIAQEGRRVQPKLVDFGIAKVEESLDRITNVGTVLGSPSYMAPEQALGLSDVDHRADIWAVAMVLYEAVAGHVASGERRVGSMFGPHAAIPPLRDDRGRETNLWWILERALRRDRGQRIDSARAFGAELAGFLLSQGVTQDICGESITSNWSVSSVVTLPGSSATPLPGSVASPEPPLSELSAYIRSSDAEPHAASEQTLVSRYEPELVVPSEPLPVTMVALPSRPPRSRLTPALLAAAILVIFALASGKPAVAFEAAFGPGFFGAPVPAKANPASPPPNPGAAAAAVLPACETLSAHSR